MDFQRIWDNLKRGASPFIAIQNMGIVFKIEL